MLCIRVANRIKGVANRIKGVANLILSDVHPAIGRRDDTWVLVVLPYSKNPLRNYLKMNM